MVFIVILAASFTLLYPSLLFSKVPTTADILQFISYPWGASQTILRPQNSFSSDPITQYYVFFSFAREMFQSSELPLWNPYIYAGAPFLANPQSVVFYPYSLFIYLLPLNAGITLLLISNLVTAGFGMYLLLRRGFAFMLTPSLIGAFSWMFSGSMIGFLYYPNSYVLAWLPLMLFFTDRLVITARFSYCSILAFVFSFSVLGGHPDVTGVVVLVAVAYFLIQVIAEYWNERSFSLFFRKVGLFVIAVLLGIGIASIQLLPCLEYMQLSYRFFSYEKGAASGHTWAMGSITPLRYILTLLYPNTFTSSLFNYNYARVWVARTYAGYSGIIALALIPLGMRYGKRDRRVIFFLAILLLSLWYAFAWPAKPNFIYHLPVLQYIESTDFLYLASFSCAALGSFSLNTLLLNRRDLSKSISKALLLDLISFFALSGLLIVHLVTDQGLRNMIDTSPSAILPLKVFAPLGFERYLSLFMVEVVFSLFVLTASMCVLYLLLRARTTTLRTTMLQSFLIILVLSNLMFYATPFNSQSEPSFAYPRTNLIDFISNTRIAQLTLNSPQLALNSPMFFRIQSVAGYDNFLPLSYAQLVSEDKAFETNVGGVTDIYATKSPLFNLLGVKYFVVSPNSELSEGYDDLTLGVSSLASSRVIAELHAGTVIGQTFTASHMNLTKISVALATGGRVYTRESGFTFIYVRKGVNGPVLYTSQANNAEIRKDFWMNFTFPAIKGSQGKEFSFWLTSNSSVGQGLFPWYHPINQNPGTYLFVNSTAVAGSLVFKTYYRAGTPTNLTLVYSGEDGKVYRNNLAYPRAFMVYRYVHLSDDTEIVKLLNSPDFDSRNIVVLTEEVEAFSGEGTASDSAFVNITDYRPNRVSIEVSTSSAGILLLTDQYYPGWQAFVNDKETKIYQADCAFRAVVIPAGDSTVTFIYNPKSFVAGASITPASLIFSIIFLAFFKYRSVRTVQKEYSRAYRRNMTLGATNWGTHRSMSTTLRPPLAESSLNWTTPHKNCKRNGSNEKLS